MTGAAGGDDCQLTAGLLQDGVQLVEVMLSASQAAARVNDGQNVRPVHVSRCCLRVREWQDGESQRKFEPIVGGSVYWGGICRDGAEKQQEMVRIQGREPGRGGFLETLFFV